MTVLLANNATSNLAGGLTASATTLSVTSGHGARFPNPGAGQWFPLTVIKVSGVMEIMRCTSRSGDVLTVVRAQESTAAQTFTAGDRIELRLTAETALAITESSISRSDEKTTLADDDLFGIIDSAASGLLKKLTWTNLKTAIRGAQLFLQSGVGSTPRTYEEKLRERLSLEDKGGVSGGSTSANSAAYSRVMTDASSARREIDLNGGQFTLASIPGNTYGTRFKNGKILIPVAAGTTALQSYAPDAGGLYFGREHMSAFWRQASNNGNIDVFVCGDSTVSQNGAYTVPCHTMIRQAAWSAGVNKINVVNRGVSGSSWSDLSVISDLGATTKLIVIKYGINDAVKADPLTTLAADARSKLTAIRANANGSLDKLSILLMLPTSTYSPSTGQDAKWYEDLRNLYIQLAYEFQCAVFDTYAWMQDTRNAPGFWLDVTNPGQGIHPDFIETYLTWKAPFSDIIFASGQSNSQKSNEFWNLSLASRTPSTATPPTGYPYGITVESALTANGWPINGVMVTIRNADSGVAVQTIYSQDVVPRTASRRGGGAAWTQFTGVPTAVTLLNSWANKGGGYADPGFIVGDDGFVTLYGTITGGVLGAAAFNLPATARPAFAHLFATAGAAGGGTAASITIFGDGNVVVSAAANTTIALDGIRFRYGA